MSLPIECIEAILDALYDLMGNKALLLFLTVNRVFFYQSVRRLYANPVETLKASCHENRWRTTPGALGLAALVVRYSPAQDADVQWLRSRLSVEAGALPETPTVDYLSLIKSIPFSGDFFGPSTQVDSFRSTNLWSDFKDDKVSLHDTLTWAACGHRLSDVLDMEISWNGLGRYVGLVDNMTQLRSIRLRLLDPPSLITNDWIDRYQPVLQRGLQSVSRFMDKWSEAYAKRGAASRRHMDIQLASNETRPEWWTIEPLAQELKSIFRQMPVAAPLLEISDRNILEWVRYHLAPETVDLSRVQAMVVTKSYVVSKKSQLQEHIATILPRCQSLRRFELECWSKSDIGHFAWDLAGDSTTRTMMVTRGGHCTVPPLSDLKLTLHVSVAWEHAIHPFGATLQSVTIRDRSWRNRIDLCVFQNMPELRKLAISANIAENSSFPLAFSGCPNLQEVDLYNGASGNFKQFDRWDLRSVRILTLGGPICRFFHLGTLQTMTRLERLSFSDGYSEISPDNGPPLAWNMEYWVDFPRLEQINLYGPMAQAFRWQMLDKCPRLEGLYLGVPFTHAKQPVLAMESSTLPLTAHLALKHLFLRGFYIAHSDLMDVLPAIVPNINTLSLVRCIGLDAKQQDALEAKFPRLDCYSIK